MHHPRAGKTCIKDQNGPFRPSNFFTVFLSSIQSNPVGIGRPFLPMQECNPENLESVFKWMVNKDGMSFEISTRVAPGLKKHFCINFSDYSSVFFTYDIDQTNIPEVYKAFHGGNDPLRIHRDMIYTPPGLKAPKSLFGAKRASLERLIFPCGLCHENIKNPYFCIFPLNFEGIIDIHKYMNNKVSC